MSGVTKFAVAYTLYAGVAERMLDKMIQLWLERGATPSEAWDLYSRLVEAAELLARRPDREAAERLCQTLIRAFSTVSALHLAHASCTNKGH